MKRMSALLLVLCLLGGVALAETADAMTTASVYNYYGKLEGDELMNAINSTKGFYAIASVNQDGTPNIAFFIFSCVKLEDSYYLQLGINPNQTTANIGNGSELMAIFAPCPAEDAQYPYPVTGARMYLRKVTDETVNAELLKSAPAGYAPMYYEISEIIPLG